MGKGEKKREIKKENDGMNLACQIFRALQNCFIWKFGGNLLHLFSNMSVQPNLKLNEFYLP